MFTSFPNIGAIFLGRAILGLGLGVVSVVVPVLLAEIAGDDNRGAITIMHQVMQSSRIVSLQGYLWFGSVTSFFFLLPFLSVCDTMLVCIHMTYVHTY
jgi:MFS family permease